MVKDKLIKVKIKKYNYTKNQKKEAKIKILVYLICLLVSFASGLLIGTKMKIRKNNPKKIK